MDAQTHLRAALGRLDLLLHREILRLRAAYELSLDEFRGLYVSDEQVDRLVDEALRDKPAATDVAGITERAEAMRQEIAAEMSADLPGQRLVTEFGLSSFEKDVLLLALAPELELKYETLYAYLNNDVGRKWPTHDLALRLCTSTPEERWNARRALLPEGTLFGSGLLRAIEPPQAHPSALAAGFAATPLLLRHVLGLPLHDPRLAPIVTYLAPSDDSEAVHLPAEQLAALTGLARLCKESPTAPVLVFEGRPGSGRGQAAAHLCRTIDLPLLQVDLEAARAAADSLPELLKVLALRQRLERSAVYAAPLEALLDSSGQRMAEARAIIAALTALPGPVILATTPGIGWRELLGEVRVVHVAFRDPARDERYRLWRVSLAERGFSIPATALDDLADRFALNAGQIRRVVAVAADSHGLIEGIEASVASALFRAARDESGQELGKLAVKVETPHGWEDLVLPAATLQRVKEIAAAIRHRDRVFQQWGFARRVAAGRGLKVLFAGTSGTGKTMTAGVIARDLGVDLYKIDLSGVVSKYIGETEKNLDRIFRAAQSSSAILFFDEADALFGKRSEVKDAHDRYANIEISYLLQKMEEHEGAVILATNLRKNIDEAFGRRMHYVIEFPVPDAKHRERLWRGMFPPTVPLGDDIDFSFLARQFDLAGGDIQNVALDAAFLAAQDGGSITMQQLVNAMARQMSKQGRLASATEFKQYHTLITPNA
jgi:MoxR-like ATPase